MVRQAKYLNTGSRSLPVFVWSHRLLPHKAPIHGTDLGVCPSLGSTASDLATAAFSGQSRRSVSSNGLEFLMLTFGHCVQSSSGLLSCPCSAWQIFICVSRPSSMAFSLEPFSRCCHFPPPFQVGLSKVCCINTDFVGFLMLVPKHTGPLLAVKLGLVIPAFNTPKSALAVCIGIRRIAG